MFWNRAYAIWNSADRAKVCHTCFPSIEAFAIYLKQEWDRVGGICAYTGYKMQLSGRDNENLLVWSVDRKDPKGIYSKKNIALCLNFINRMKNILGENELVDVCTQIIRHIYETKLGLGTPQEIGNRLAEHLTQPHAGDAPPASIYQLWLDDSTNPPIIKKYDEDQGCWVTVK